MKQTRGLKQTPHFRDSDGFEFAPSTDGETIEEKLRRVLNNKEPIKDGAPIVYTPRKDGVLPGTNIRTDRFEVAIDATEKIAKSYKARREERMKPLETGEIGGAKPIQGEPGTGTNKA